MIWVSRRAIERRHPLGGSRVVAADHDPIGMQEVVDRRALAQELGVGHDRNVGTLQHPLDHPRRTDRHRRLVDHHRSRPQHRRDLGRCRLRCTRGRRCRRRPAAWARTGTRCRRPPPRSRRRPRTAAGRRRRRRRRSCRARASTIGISPASSRATLPSSMSAHTTSNPRWAKQAPVVSPTYPVPTTAIAGPLPLVGGVVRRFARLRASAERYQRDCAATPHRSRSGRPPPCQDDRMIGVVADAVALVDRPGTPSLTIAAVATLAGGCFTCGRSTPTRRRR